MQDLGGGREIAQRISARCLRPRGLELPTERTNELRQQIERGERGNECWEVDDGELQPDAVAQCVQEFACERETGRQSARPATSTRSASRIAPAESPLAAAQCARPKGRDTSTT